MKPKHQRLVFVVGSLVVMALAATAIFTALQENMVYFYTPAQWVEKKTQPGFDTTQTIRIGGLVKTGSIRNRPDRGLRFIITDMNKEIPVTYQGLVPTLFRDGQGVVAQGTIGADGMMQAQSILAKHDENYMPREVVEALKASGQWKEYGSAGAQGAPRPRSAPPRSPDGSGSRGPHNEPSPTP